jgi:hypothetical protein
MGCCTPLAMLGGAGLAILLGRMKHDALVQVSGNSMKGSMDPNLPPEFERAVLTAVEREKDPRALRTFGQTLLDDYPVAASLLLARATNLEHGTLAPVIRVEGDVEGDEAGLNLNPFHAIKSVLIDKLGHEIEKVPVIKSVAKEVDKIHKHTIFGKIFDVYEGVAMLQPAVFGHMIMKSVVNKTMSGERLDRVLNDTRKTAGHWAKNEAAYVAMVPGVGTALAPVYSAAGSLALGEPIPQGIVDVAASALPGGPVVQTAAKTGGTFGLALAQGKKVDQAALSAAREALPTQARPAFDAGLALAQGQSLQKVGFKAAADLLQSQGGSIAEKVLDASHLAPIAQSLGKSLEDVAGDRLKGQLSQIAATAGRSAADLVHPLVKQIVSNPTLANLTSTQLAAHVNIPEPVARAALASLKRAGSSFVVNQARLHGLTGHARPAPPKVADRGHVKLALAAARGNTSAQKQLSFQKAQSPANAESISDAQIMAARALWASRYMDPSS